MLSLTMTLALLAQCPGGACSVQAPAYYPQFTVPAVRYAAPAAAPTLYRLADRTGQVWQHADHAYLQVWVAQRNGLVLTTPAGGR